MTTALHKIDPAAAAKAGIRRIWAVISGMRIVVIILVTIISALACAQAEEPGVVDGLLRRARNALAKGQSEEALALANKAVERTTDNSRAYLLRGMIQDRLEKYDRASADYSKVIALDPHAAEAYDRRGSARFKLGQVVESAADFDKVVELKPAEKAGHWRRGISLYYAGRFEEGQRQFEEGQAVYGNDAENAVWCYLCMARRIGRDKARAAMLKIGKDRRVPMMEIYALFCGRATPADVLAAARANNPQGEVQSARLFYAHLYLGLYYESEGDAKRALEHLTRAANLRIDHYMWDVARVHRDLLLKKAQ